MVTDRVNITIAKNMKSHIGFRLAYLDLSGPIVKVKVKVMRISTANISAMVTDWANIIIAIK